ncbi:MAG: hypothetical protein L0H59_11000 [Tomitella sp.]|nr:hypothetical protein [Tomitella sp.]
MTHTVTRGDLENAVTTAIDNGATSHSDYDIDTIVDELYTITDSFDPAAAHHDAFWAVIADHPLQPEWGAATSGDYTEYQRAPDVAPLAAAAWRGVRILFGIDLDSGGPARPTLWVITGISPAGAPYSANLPTGSEQTAMLQQLGADTTEGAGISGVIFGDRPDWCDPQWWDTATHVVTE